MRDFLREIIKFTGMLAQEYTWVRKALWAAGGLLLLAVIIAAWPRSPQHTVRTYLAALQNGQCRDAWEHVAKNQRTLMDSLNNFDSFTTHVCEPVADGYDKLYYEPWKKEILSVAGNRADLRFCVCARPDTRARRLCAVHQAVLVREHFRWKILDLPLGAWDKEPCEWNRQRPEELIKPESPQKNPGATQ